MKGFRVIHETNTLPSENCPYCQSKCFAEWENYGSCSIQVAPYKCDNCGATEIGRYDKNENYEFSEYEQQTGWYKSK